MKFIILLAFGSILISAVASKGRIILFSSIFDVIINAVCSGIALAFLITAILEENANITNGELLSAWLVWGIIAFLFLLFANSMKAMKAFLGIPAKMFFSILFLVSAAGLISAIFRKQDSSGKRLGKGALSGLSIYLCSKLIYKNKICHKGDV